MILKENSNVWLRLKKTSGGPFPNKKIMQNETDILK